MNTLYAIIGIFAVGAMVGLYLLTLILQDKATPKGIAFTHGFFVVAAMVVLIVYTTSNPPGPIESLIAFIVAAVGGLILFYKDITGKKIPKWLAVVHGLVAVTGFVLLVMFAVGK